MVTWGLVPKTIHKVSTSILIYQRKFEYQNQDLIIFNSKFFETDGF